MSKAAYVLSLVVGGLLVAGCGSGDGSESSPGGSGGAAGSAGSAGQAGNAGTGGTGPAVCGDGTCSADESCESCPEDCICEQPSCEDALVCGDVSCCDSQLVPGGDFMMGRAVVGSDACPCEEACKEHEQPEHEGHVSEFHLDTFEVTVGRFRVFVEQYEGPPEPGAGAHPRIPDSGWDEAWNNEIAPDATLLAEALICDPQFGTWSAEGDKTANRPINCVSWFEAFAFCAWDGGRLPTEMEWEYAAAGGALERQYPWGEDEPTEQLASYDCLFDGLVGCEGEDLPDVGSTPMGRGHWNHQDLSGGLYEWTLDWFDPAWYAGAGATCDDCANLAAGTQRAIRGGSFSHTTPTLRTVSRDDMAPSERTGSLGFRCARDL